MCIKNIPLKQAQIKKGLITIMKPFCTRSTYTDGMRKVFSVKWPIRVLRRGQKGNEHKIDYQKLLNLYPVLNDANQIFYTKIVDSKTKKKKKKPKSRVEQLKIYQEVLDSGEVKNQAEIAQKFGVSRAWVSKVLS